MPIDDPHTLSVHGYLVFAHLGFAAGCGVALRSARASGVRPGELAWLFPVVYVGAVVGSRLLSVVADGQLHTYLRHPLGILTFWRGGLVFYGGLIGGALAALATARWRGLSFRRCSEACAAGTCLGVAIARVGCFVSGCCYGSPTTWPIGIEAHNFALPPRPVGVPLHPSALYESVLLLPVFWVLVRRKRDGAGFLVFLCAYAAIRFFVELTRADPRGAWGALSTSQLIAVATVIFAIFAWPAKAG